MCAVHLSDANALAAPHAAGYTNSALSSNTASNKPSRGSPWSRNYIANSNIQVCVRVWGGGTTTRFVSTLNTVRYFSQAYSSALWLPAKLQALYESCLIGLSLGTPDNLVIQLGAAPTGPAWQKR